MAKKSISIELNGKSYDVKFTLGAIEDFSEEIGADMGWHTEIARTPKNLRLFLYHAMKGQGVTREMLRDLEMSELNKAVSGISGEANPKKK